MKIKTNGINHVALNVEDIEKSMAWYQEVFGFSVKDRGIHVPDIYTDGTLEVAHMDAGDFDIEFFHMEGSQAPAEDCLYNKRRGNKHFSLNIDSRFEARKIVESMGVKVELFTPDSLFIKDNDGHLIELFDGGVPEE